MAPCYKDKTFCSSDCSNKNCKINKLNIDSEHVAKVGLPVCYQNFSVNCRNYVGIKQKIERK